jgi:hypothetical protein
LPTQSKKSKKTSGSFVGVFGFTRSQAVFLRDHLN